MDLNDPDSEEREQIIKRLRERFFVPADDSDEYEIVSNPESDDEDDEKYLNDDEIHENYKHLSPLQLVERAYAILQYNPIIRKEDFEKNTTWICTLVDGEKIFEARNPSMYVARHLAAIQLIEDAIKKDISKCNYFGLPKDLEKCDEILKERTAALKNKSQFTTEQIGNKDPKSLLYEFATFYKLPQMKFIKEEEVKDSDPKLFGVTALFRGQEFYAEGDTKQVARTAVARLFLNKLDENDELDPYLHDQQRKSIGKEYRNKILNSSEIENEFDAYFLDGPVAHVKACANVDDISKIIPNEDIEFIVSKGLTIEDATKNSAIYFLRSAFCNKTRPYLAYFEQVLPFEKVDKINGFFDKYPSPPPWENE